jgi:hypothetical protein
MAWQCTRRYEVGEVVIVFARADAGGQLILPMCFGITAGDTEAELGPGTPVGGTAVTPTQGATSTGTVTPVASPPNPTAAGRKLWLPMLATPGGAGSP